MSGAGAGAATVPGERKRPAGYEAALQSIGNLQVEQLRKRAFSSLGEESRTAQQVGIFLDTIVSQGLKGKAKATQLTAVREFLADALATAAGKNIEARMQPIQGRDPNRRGAFPYVAKTGPIESKVLFEEAIALAAKIDAQLTEQARLLQEQTRRQAQYLARQNELLRNAATRFLPSAKEQIGGRSAQSQVVGNFYDRIRKTEKVFAQNFSANSYLPRASMMLASSMDGAATQLKALPATRIAGALPSSEMRLAPRRELYRDILSRGSIPTSNARPWQKPSAAGPMALPPARIAGLLEPADVQNQRKFRKAIEVAATADAVNAAKHREQLKVNAENQVRAKEAAKRDLRNMFTGLPPIQAPSIGQEKAPLSRAATRSLNKARQLLGMSIGPTSPYAANPWAGSSTVPPVTPTAPSRALPPAGATSNYGVTAQRQAMAQAFQSYGFRQAPSIPPPMAQAPAAGASPPGGPPAPPGGGGPWAQTPLSLGYYKNAFKYSEALKVADASMRNFSASQIPLIGGIKNLAGEFGQAAKQVLIYGTAYKGLALITSLPGQVLNAAKSQQQFTNGLKVATQDTGTFGKELLYVDNVQRAFGLNLETTRTGFTRLYASMAPTGFDSGSIEKLFTGISAATASLQLTPDKAERVIYAFGQMASKGQIMSEELKGQLGDVLPGALAIFSKAAGMSVKDFSKAMEDGVFVGGRFREVFAKVSDELMNSFGTGAQAAGRSLQGLINTVGGDFQRTLESFAPLANSAAQAILGPLGGSLKQLALSAQIATGEIERVFTQLKESQQDLKDLRASAGTDGIITADEARQIKAAEQNVAALTVKYKSLQQAASDPAIAKQVQDITKFTEELSKAGTFVMNVAKTIGGLLSPAINFLGTNLTTVIGLITSFYIGFQTARLAAMSLMGVLLLYRTLSAILGFGPAALGANALAAAFNGLGIAATGAQVKVIGLRWALGALVASTVIGAVVGGIMLIVSAFASMRDRANEASQASRDAAKSAVDAAQMGGVAQAAMSIQTILGESRKAAAARKALEGIMARSTKAQRAGIEPMSLSVEDSVALKGSPLTKGMVKPALDGNPQMQVPPKLDAAQIFREFGSVAGHQDLNLREAKSALATAIKVAKETGQNIPTPGATPPEDTSAADTKAADKARQEAEKRLQQEQQRAIEFSNHGNNLEKIDFDRKMQLSDSAFEHEKSLIDSLNEYRLSGLNDMQARQEKVVQDLKKIQLDAIDTVRKATQKAQEAQLNVVTAQRTAAAAVTGAPLAPALPSPSGAGARKLPGSNSGRLDASGENGADMPVGRNNTIQSYHNGVVKAIARQSS